MDLELRDKVAVITGGSKGIGRAIAEAFAAEGADTVICARGESELVATAVAIEQETGRRCLPVPVDITDTDAAGTIASAATAELGGVDFLINNAGMGSDETIMESDDARWQYYWDLHVMAAVRLARAIVPLMRERGGGAIVHNASICAKQPLYYEPIYNTTKAALVMFSKCLSNEVVKDNIRVNTVNPGLVLTPDWMKTATAVGAQEGISAEQYLDGIAKESTPMGRFASPEEVASFFLFLCSPRASYCTGSTYYVDAGWLRVIS